MTNKQWTIIHQNRYSPLYRCLDEELKMKGNYDDFREVQNRKLMTIIEKSTKKDGSDYSKVTK